MAILNLVDKNHQILRQKMEDFDFENAKLIIDYYFTLSKEGHPLSWLFNNFDKLKEKGIEEENFPLITVKGQELINFLKS